MDCYICEFLLQTMYKPEGMQAERSDREQVIIKKAQERFGLFGVEKTSMRELAEDLNMSKASLYYYFPDKESLYKAVIEKEQDEYLTRIMDKIASIKEADQLLREYAISRISYFRTLLNLSRLRMKVYSDLRPVLKETLQKFREKEKGIIIQVLDRGIAEGIFFCDDKESAALLFLDLMRGLRMTILNERKSLVLDQEEFEKILEKTSAAADLFIRSLKYH